MANRRVLMVVTGHDQIAPDQPTGIWLSEFTEPYTLFRNAGYDVTVGSIPGGKAPVDPRSLTEPVDDDTAAAMKELEATTPLLEVNTVIALRSALSCCNRRLVARPCVLTGRGIVH